MYDVDQDGEKDIFSGRYLYRNPGRDMAGDWKRTELGLNVDTMLVVNVDDDELTDVIGEALPDVYWIGAEDMDIVTNKPINQFAHFQSDSL